MEPEERVIKNDKRRDEKGERIGCRLEDLTVNGISHTCNTQHFCR